MGDKSSAWKEVYAIMNIKRAEEEIVNTVKAYLQKDELGNYIIPPLRQRPVLLIGPPGIGKTAIMEQAARDCGIAFVSYTMTHHTRQSAMGLPFISKKVYGGREYSVTEYTMSEIIASVYDKMESTNLKEGILFIDEINCVSETLAPVMLQFLQGKSFGSAKVPEGWIITAAGNPPEYNRSVREFDVVTLDRVRSIGVEADYDVWREYAKANGLHGAIIAYLDARHENFYKVETTVDGKHFITARGWEDLSELLYAYERLGIAADKEVVGQYLCDARVAVDFANYLELYYVYEKTYDMESILLGEEDEKLRSRLSKASFDEKVSVVSLLISRLNKGFAEYAHLTRTVDAVFSALKTFKKRLDSECEALPVSVFSDIIKEENKEYMQKSAAGLYARDEDKSMQSAVMQLDAMSVKLAGSGEQDADKAFDIVRHSFLELSEKRESKIALLSQQLNNAYEFMDKTFGDSPQTVLFTTELSAGRDSTRFIEENGCDEFYRHNNALLQN